MTKQRIEVVLIIVVLITAGMLGTIIPCVGKPKDRICAGFHGYSPDYVQYVSYIKEGIYGRYHMLFRSFPPDQPTSPIHFEYILPGILAAPLGLQAPVVYHLLRITLGAAFVWLVYRFYRYAFHSHAIAILSTFLAFISASFGWWDRIYSYFPFFMSTPQRVADRPHYLMGSVLFLVLLERLWRGRPQPATYLFLLIGSAALIMVHLSSGFILAGIAVIFLFEKRLRVPALAVLAGAGAGAAITYAYVQIYGRVSDIFLDKFIYSTPLTVEVIMRELISFGPTLVIGLPGLIIGLILVRDTTWNRRVLMAGWAFLHLVPFFVLYKYVHVDRIRFIQSLYFIPLTYGTIWTLLALSKRFHKHIFTLGVAFLLFISLPTYLTHLYQDVFATTDYTHFSFFAFPTKNQYAAYMFLDRNTPKESTVMASYEAANLLLMYSHNKTLGNDQGWTPEGGLAMKKAVAEWFAGGLDPIAAQSYLTNNNISYIYYGYQERIGPDIGMYPFLENAYQNPEVSIYRVKR